MSLAWEPIHLYVKPPPCWLDNVRPDSAAFRNSSPRLASSSKDGTVRVWSVTNRRVEYTLGGHTASVNVVKWGGIDKGILYTASSDRTVRVWDASNVGFTILTFLRITVFQGRPLHTLKDHAHWVTTLALNTDYVLRTGPFDHTNRRSVSDEDGTIA
jgi:ribosome assembly protein 4